MTMTLKETVSSESSFMKKLAGITLIVVCLAILFTAIHANSFMLRMGVVFQVLGVISTICLLFSFFIYSFWKSRLTDENESVEIENYQCWVNPNDAPSSAGAALSFFLPVVGLILWAAWDNSSPLKAKSCRKGALASLAVLVAAGVVSFQLLALQAPPLPNDVVALSSDKDLSALVIENEAILDSNVATVEIVEKTKEAPNKKK